MIDPDVRLRLIRQIRAEQRPLPPPARRMAEAIGQRHGATVRAFLYYGSSWREADTSGRMLDFYVLVDQYRDVHGFGPKWLASLLVPPSVHYLELPLPDGTKLRCKYAIMSERAFHRRTRGGAFESMLWGRFAQPVLIEADTPERFDDLVETLALACHHLAHETLPLLRAGAGLDELWVRALHESYRTELRPERTTARARELVARYSERYGALTRAIFGETPEARRAWLDGISPTQRQLCRIRWGLRRGLGKLMAGVRVVKAAFTFDAGLDYIVEKIESHASVRIDVTDDERRHPLRHAPFLAWKILRAGALR